MQCDPLDVKEKMAWAKGRTCMEKKRKEDKRK